MILYAGRTQSKVTDDIDLHFLIVFLFSILYLCRQTLEMSNSDDSNDDVPNDSDIAGIKAPVACKHDEDEDTQFCKNWSIL